MSHKLLTVLPGIYRFPEHAGERVALFLLGDVGAHYPVRKGTKHAWVRLDAGHRKDREAYPDLPGERAWYVRAVKVGAWSSVYSIANPISDDAVNKLLLRGFIVPRLGKKALAEVASGGWLSTRHYLLRQPWMHVRLSENALASIVAIEQGK